MGVDDPQHLRKLVDKCSPVLRIGHAEKNKDKVVFSHREFAAHLKTKLHGDDDQYGSQAKQYHGLLAIRCFKYINSLQRKHGSKRFPSAQTTELKRSQTVSARLTDEAEVLVVSNEEEEEMSDGAATAAPTMSWHDCLYPIKYMMHHLSEGFPDVVDELFQEDPEFWNGSAASPLREAWLKSFQYLTAELKGLNTSGMSPLHVAAGIEAADLVAVLVGKCGVQALTWASDDGLTAVSMHLSHSLRELTPSATYRGDQQEGRRR